MARRKLTEVVRYLRQLANPEHTSGLSDAELLERYVHHRDEAAFELLLWRHGVLVFNVCRRILPREEDAEDAFQATFLAFVRKAPSIARGGSVSSWLYKVAYRVALEARERARKTAALEKPGGESLAVQAALDPVWSDLRPILDEELSRLPERLRRPLILCHLEGKSNEEAARELGCRLGTIYSRLSRGREMLRKRLLRRGVTLSVAALMAALAEHAAEAAPITPLVRAAIGAARSFAGLPMGGPISPRATALAEGVLRTMFVAKLKIVALMLFVAGAVAAGGVLSHTLTAAPQEEAKAKDPAPKQEAAPKPEAKPISVKVVKPTPGGLARTAYAPGKVIAAQQQQLVPLISGTVKEVPVDIGDRVKKGQVLIVLDAPLIAKEWEQATSAFEMAQAEEQEAEARVVIAEAEVEAAEALRKVREGEKDAAVGARIERQRVLKSIQEQIRRVPGSVTRDDVENAKTKVDVAEAQIKAAEAAIAAARADIKIKQGKLAHAKAASKAASAAARSAHAAMDKARIQESFTQIKAAFDGVVTRRTADPGNFVQPSDSRLLTPLLTLQRLDQVRVVAQIHGWAAPILERGDAVVVDVATVPSIQLRDQKIARFSRVIDTSQNGDLMRETMTVEIDVPNTDMRLLPGMGAQATVHLKKRFADALVVPASCVGEHGLGSRRLFVIRDGKAHETLVEVSYDDGKNVEISKGIKASDLIAINKGQLKEGAPVEIKKEP